jgi:hypothetical protein
MLSLIDFLFAHLGAFFCALSTGVNRFLLSIGGLLGETHIQSNSLFLVVVNFEYGEYRDGNG